MLLRFTRRLVGAALVMLAVSLVAFALLDLAPGDAAVQLAGDTASQQELDALRRELGLDAPFLTRYAQYLSGALQGNWGTSIMYNRPVGALVLARFEYTLSLTLSSLSLALLLGLSTGFLAARRAGGWLDLALMSTSALGLALPSFWLALLFVMVFGVRLGWLPTQGAGTPAHLVLPAACLALPSAALFARLSRSSLLDATQSDYVRTAYAKGASARRVWREHIWRNSLVPVLTMAGLQLGHMLAGTVVIETIFAWPGLGRLIVEAIFDRDFPILLASVLLVAAFYQAITLIVDLAHAWVDPRVQTEPF